MPPEASPANPMCVNCGGHGFAHGGMIADRSGRAFCSPDCGWSYMMRPPPLPPRSSLVTVADMAPPPPATTVHVAPPAPQQAVALAQPEQLQQQQQQVEEDQLSQEERAQTPLLPSNPEPTQPQQAPQPAQAQQTQQQPPCIMHPRTPSMTVVAVPSSLGKGGLLRQGLASKSGDSSNAPRRVTVLEPRQNKRERRSLARSPIVPVSARKPPRQATSLPENMRRSSYNAMFEYHSCQMDFEC